MVSGRRLFWYVCSVCWDLGATITTRSLICAHYSPTPQASRAALGSDLPKLEFVDLLAGFELFTRVGTALPEATIECVICECQCK